LHQAPSGAAENLPDKRALLRLAAALIDQYCGLFRQVPRRIVLDIDDTFDRVHGGQQLRLFNAVHNDYGFQPIVVFDGEGRFVTAMLRPGQRPSGSEARALLRRLIAPLRARWPRVAILVRADSRYTVPEVLDWCRANRVDTFWVCGAQSGAAPACGGVGRQHEGALCGARGDEAAAV
jgi:Transposase DDE domain group 1